MAAPNYDFSSPFFKAAIIVNPGKGPSETRYDLWFQNQNAPISANVGQLLKLDGYTGGDESGKLSFDTLSIVSDVSVELGLGYIPQLAATLTPTFENGRKLLDSEIIEWSTSALEIQFGYANSVSSPPFRGLIGQPDISYGTDITIGLKAQGVAGYFLNTTGFKGVIEKKTRLAHINALSAALKVDRGPDDLDADATTLLNLEESIVSGTKSYLAVIYDLARPSNCWVDLSENKLRLVSMTKFAQDPPRATLALYDFPDGKIGPSIGPDGQGIYPILSASSDNTAVYLSSYSKAAVIEAIDRTTKQETTGKQDPKSVVSAQKGDVLPDNKSAEKSSYAQPSKDNSDAGAAKVQEQADAAMQALVSTNGAGLKLEIETLGFPDLLPKQNVNVQGLGKRIDGIYSVFKVVHKLSSSGYTTSISLTRSNAMLTAALGGGLANAQSGQGAPQTPTQLAPEGATVPVVPQVQ